MKKRYINVPPYTTFREVRARSDSLSATQYKSLCIANKNLRRVSDFLDRGLERSDLGSEVGSESYVEASACSFMRTKALQPYSYLPETSGEALQPISPRNYVEFGLKEGDVLVCKDSNVGEAVILERDYPGTMLCGGIDRLPVTTHKHYLLAFMKSEIVRQQIDYLIPRGSTLRHGKTKFLECSIPMPNRDTQRSIQYVELLVQAIVRKEKEMRRKHREILRRIEKELRDHQGPKSFCYALPTFREVAELERLDSALFAEKFKQNEFLIHNYAFGTKTITELGFEISRGQNLQVSNIGTSIYSDEKREGFYTLVRPMNISEIGTVLQYEYLGNGNQLLCLRRGDIIFGAEGTFRSFVVIDEVENVITNIHGITLNQHSHSIEKGVFVKLLLDYYRSKQMVGAYAVGGNGGSLAIKYWDFLRFPNFPEEREREITRLYHNAKAAYHPGPCGLNDFLSYDDGYNQEAGIYEIDRSMKYLQDLLEKAVDAIANDIPVSVRF